MTAELDLKGECLMSDIKFSREELAAKLEAKAKELRESQISDEDVEKMSAGCSACCRSCQFTSHICFADFTEDYNCSNDCVKSSPD